MMSKKEIQLLCVEDNLGDQYLIREFLLKNDRINYQLTESTYLSQACQYARESAYDICLLDLSLPDSQGLQTLQDFRFYAPNLPIIILTDHDNEQFELDAIALGAQDYLVKSQITQIWLNRTIHHAIERAQLVAKLRKSESKLREFNQELLSHAEERTETIYQLQELTMTDTLTKTANRRGLEHYLNQWCSKVTESTPLSAIMIDIDYFKQYNDTYGHPQGDACLKNIAIALKKGLNRPHDFLARYGGEEFIVILPDTPKSGAIKVAKTMQNNVATMKIPHISSGISDKVTVSLGIATASDSCERLVLKADKALYRAKQNGRDRLEYLNSAQVS